MEEIVVEKATDMKLLIAKDYEHVRRNCRKITDSCIVRFQENGESRFLAKYRKGVLNTKEFKERLEASSLAMNHKPGTYCRKHDVVSSSIYEEVLREAGELKEFVLRDHDEFSYFYNEPIHMHQDSNEYKLNSVFVLKDEAVTGLLIFPFFNLYYEMEEGDLLIFNESEYHYVTRNCPISLERYRYAVNFHLM